MNDSHEIPEPSKVSKRALVSSMTWSKPELKVFDVAQLTRLGFATNCDGGFGLDAIDGNAIGCN